MDTKINERLQGPLRRRYQRQSNFRDIEKQVRICILLRCLVPTQIFLLQLARLEDHSATASVIRAHIKAWDIFRASTTADLDDDDDEPAPSDMWQFGHIYLGARQTPLLIQHFVDSRDQAFTAFRFRLSTCLTSIVAWQHANNELPGPAVQDERRVTVPETTVVCELLPSQAHT